MRSGKARPASLLILLAVMASAAPAWARREPPPPVIPTAETKQAQELFRAGRVAEAIDALGAELRDDPTDAQRRIFLFELLCFAGNYARAEKQLDAAYKLAPNAEDVVVALGEVRRRLGDFSGATQVLAEFVKQNPEAGLARTALVSALREGGNVDQAIAEAQAALVRRANDPYALSELALAQLDRGEVDTAELLSEEGELVDVAVSDALDGAPLGEAEIAHPDLGLEPPHRAARRVQDEQRVCIQLQRAGHKQRVATLHPLRLGGEHGCQ